MTLRSSAYAAIMVVFLGIVPGEMFKLYDKIPYFDKVLHFTGGFVLGLLMLALFRKDQKTMSPYTFAVLILGSATVVGVLWEHAEFLSGYFTKDYFPLIYRYFHGGNLRDTLADLACDMVGTLTFLLIHARFTRFASDKKLL